MKAVFSLLFLLAASCANASVINVEFSFDSIAAGNFSYDSSLDGSVISYSDLNSFELNFSGLTNSSYDLAFVLSGNSSIFNLFQFDSSVDAFLSQNINGFYTTFADIKNSFTEGFFIRDDANIIRDYAGGGDQFYQTFTLSRSTAIPEPPVLALLLLGLSGLAVARKRAAN